MFTGKLTKFYVSTEVIFGTGCLESIDFKEGSKILIIISRSAERNKYIKDSIINNFIKRNITFQLVYTDKGEPTTKSIDSLFEKINKDLDVILAIGGGSVIDTAKFVSAMVCLDVKSADFEQNDLDIKRVIPVYAVPTTAGSGSEVTPYAVATNSITGRKFTIKNSKFFPQKAYVDPLVLKTLKREALLSSALDAFIHSLESVLNKKQNFLIYSFAIDSMKNLYFILQKDADKLTQEDYEKLSLSSLYGGMCIANSRTGIIHTFSVAFSKYSKEPHGILNAKILPYALEYNLDSYNGLLASIVSLVSGKLVRSDFCARGMIVDFLKSVVSDFKIDFFEEPDPMQIADRVMQDTELLSVNVKSFSKNDLVKIAEKIICQG